MPQKQFYKTVEKYRSGDSFAGGTNSMVSAVARFICNTYTHTHIYACASVRLNATKG